MTGEIEQAVNQYMADVMTGGIPACKYTKLAVKRHQTDLERVGNGVFPYHFDKIRAEKVIDFIQIFCIHVKGVKAPDPLELEPWQQFIIWVIFGWVDEKGYRRFNNVFIEVGKKNGKSTMVAGIGLYMTAGDDEEGAEVYSAATTKDQAKVVFREYARAMVVKSEELQKVFTAYAASITDKNETSTFRALSSDVDTLDGKNVHCAIIDEYHAHKTDGVYKVMSDGMSARTQPMTIIITTAGFDPDVPCVDEEDYAKRVLEGRAKNDNYFGIIYTLDKDDDWTNKEVWKKANPCLGVSKQQKAMDRDFRKALDMPAEQAKFKNKNLNIWTRNTTGWINPEDWEILEGDYRLEDMVGQHAYAAIDLSTTLDTASYTLCFPMTPAAEENEEETDQEEKKNIYRLFTRVFLPEWELAEREKRERFEWQRMADGGYVTLTAGRIIDYDYIQVCLEKDLDDFDIREIAYDPWNASQFITNLEKLGLEEKLVEFPQGWKYISPAAKDFQTKIHEKSLEVQRNPVVAWMMGNTEVKHDPNGNIRPVKPKTRSIARHIDSTFSQFMATDRAVRNKDEESVYEKRGALVFG